MKHIPLYWRETRTLRGNSVISDKQLVDNEIENNYVWAIWQAAPG